MPRSPRIHAPGAIYHVTLRGNHRQDIFFTPDDRSLLTHIITEILVDCGAQLHAYCYMSNHVHALLQVGDTPLSKIMLLVAGRYAQVWFRRRMNTRGPVTTRTWGDAPIRGSRRILRFACSARIVSARLSPTGH